MDGRCTTPLLAAATSRDFLEFFSAQMFNEPHSTKQIEDCVAWGLETDPAVIADTTRGADDLPEEAVRRDVCAGALPRARDPWRRGRDPAPRPRCRPRRRSPAARRHDRRRRARTAGTRSDPSSTKLIEQFVGHGASRRQATDVDTCIASPAQAGAVPLVADRARPRPTRRGHRRRAARPPSRPADRLARPTPGDEGARGQRRARPPGVGVARQRVGARRGRGGRARSARLPGDPAHGRDPRQQLQRLRRGRRATSTTTS